MAKGLTIGRMAMGTRKHRQRQEPLWYRAELAEAPGHPFYQRLNRVLEEADFDRFCESRCQGFYHEKLGRPSLPPGMYFRLMLIGFRGDRQRARHRLAGGRFLEFAAVSADWGWMNRRRGRSRARGADGRADAPRSVWMGAAAGGRRGLLKGKTIGIDATTLEANAAMNRAAGQRGKLYRLPAGWRRPKGSKPRMQRRCAGWTAADRRVQCGVGNPHDREAEITRMKDGRTALAYKAEMRWTWKPGLSWG